MEFSIADVTALPEELARPGERAEFFGGRRGTIGYHRTRAPLAACRT